ncbi:PhzF family phenazine biosynthesis protein [Fulvivirga sp. M361]|uniref:PhzF family phenazine biosynthesis protein n=1 Tax=Fulvivirga sp. M361 TaxID=2594266 RepID=UPI00117ADA53|nr:PhzF family phenazine biosynthesis isomerase [Fulvivirga sp. M361]TRX60812.1 PhzF family phenazine biosynthesis protein [Fulvivirga sp. M361]
MSKHKSPFSLIKVFCSDELGFLGNNAAVVSLTNEISKEEMQQIAYQLNQPATTFLWPATDGYHVKWYAPDAEIELCGHGSLAAIAYLTKAKEGNDVILHYSSGTIIGKRNPDNTCSIDFKPITIHGRSSPEQALIKGLGANITDYYATDNKNIVLLKDEIAVQSLQPDFNRLKECAAFGFIVTAKGDRSDFVSRTLVPHVQQLEDPATGSSHVLLTSFWSKRLNKTKMTGYQLSKQGGAFLCELIENNIRLTGKYACLANGHLK